MTDLLESELAALAIRLAAWDIPVIIGGGYGLVLRQRQIEADRVRTLRNIPASRSTSDLDVFLTAELIANAQGMATLRDVLADLEYQPKSGAEYYQFVRTVTHRGQDRELKIDLLAPLRRRQMLAR